MMHPRYISIRRTHLAASALKLSKASEPKILVQLVAFRVKGLPHRHVCRTSGASPLGLWKGHWTEQRHGLTEVQYECYNINKIMHRIWHQIKRKTCNTLVSHLHSLKHAFRSLWWDFFYLCQKSVCHKFSLFMKFHKLYINS